MAIFFKYIQNIRREPQRFGVDLKENETIPKFIYLQILFSFFFKMEIMANRLISVRNTFISNTILKLVKNQANTKHTRG